MFAYLNVPYMCKFLQRPENSYYIPRTGFTNGCGPPNVGAGKRPQFSARASSVYQQALLEKATFKYTVFHRIATYVHHFCHILHIHVTAL